MSSDLDAAVEIIERQIGRLRSGLAKSGAAAIEVVRRAHETDGSELRYELLVVVLPGWVTAPAVPPDVGPPVCRPETSHEANLATFHRVFGPWQKTTALAVGSVARVVRCDSREEQTDDELTRDITVQIVARDYNAARDGLTRTARAVPEGGSGLPGLDHVQSAVRGEA